MPALPSCLLEPLWDQFAAFLPAWAEFGTPWASAAVVVKREEQAA